MTAAGVCFSAKQLSSLTLPEHVGKEKALFAYSRLQNLPPCCSFSSSSFVASSSQIDLPHLRDRGWN